jgi:ureidoglycolate lyase
MKTVPVQALSVEAFLPFGYYADLIDPDTDKIGQSPMPFYRDMLQQDMGGATITSFSVVRVEGREMVIDVSEYHSRCGEGILPLDNDVLIHVAPATPPAAPVPLDEMRVFKVPQGTMVVLRPGTWHHAPYTANGDAANVLIVLPERAYANDCTVVELEPADRIKIV